jgi:hypothetical protein
VPEASVADVGWPAVPEASVVGWAPVPEASVADVGWPAVPEAVAADAGWPAVSEPSVTEQTWSTVSGSTWPAAPAPSVVEASAAAPVATLRLMGGAGKVELRSDPSLPDLYRASYEPTTPEVVLEGDRATVRYAIHRLLGRFSTAEETTSRFALSTTKPWDISAPDGVSSLDADLASARVTSFRVGHGGGTVRLRLGRPQGTVPVAVGGGAREVIVFRPEGVMVRVATQGEVTRVIIDSGRPIGPLSGNTTVEPPGYALSEDRYDISVGGGCESVLVTTEPAISA